MTRAQDCTLSSSGTEDHLPTLVTETSPVSVVAQPEINGMRDTLMTGILVIYPVVATALAIAAGLFLIGRGA